MKIGLLCFHSFAQPGGVKNHVLGLHEEFKKRGIQSKIIIPRRKVPENYGKDVILLGTSLPIKIAGTQGDVDINFNPFAINRLFKKHKFDVLHFHNFSYPSGSQILERSKSLNILTFHANIERHKILKIFPFIIKAFNKELSEKMDGIIGINQLNLQSFKEYKGPQIVIPNGIDLNKFNDKVPKLEKFNDGKINILFLGRIEERKGLKYLLKAYKILERRLGREWVSENLRLIVVGDGPLKDESRDWAQKENLINVVFEGSTKESVPSYYATCDIYCSPAIYGESFGIVLIEAMAVGKPVVAFANSGYKMVLEHGPSRQFLTRPRDYRILAKHLETLIKNPQLRQKMGEWGKKEVEKYSWPKVVDRVLDFYNYCQKRKEKIKKSSS